VEVIAGEVGLGGCAGLVVARIAELTDVGCDDGVNTVPLEYGYGVAGLALCGGVPNATAASATADAPAIAEQTTARVPFAARRLRGGG